MGFAPLEGLVMATRSGSLDPGGRPSRNARARLAVGVYTRRVRQAIGALAVTLGGVDALIFTARVGENSAEVRAACCEGLGCLGLELDAEANARCRPDADVAKAGAPARILVIATREDLTMLAEVTKVIASPEPKEG